MLFWSRNEERRPESFHFKPCLRRGFFMSIPAASQASQLARRLEPTDGSTSGPKAWQPRGCLLSISGVRSGERHFGVETRPDARSRSHLQPCLRRGFFL